MKQILIGCICALIAIGIASAQEEWMPDPSLRQAVRDELGLPNELSLQPAEMLRLTRLEASSRQITDLTGLEHAIHLTWLGIARNAIQNLTPLAELIRLERIVGFENEISDLTPLSNLTNLTWIDLGGCQISDLTPIQNLTQLEGLRVHWNLIEDITALSQLTRLEDLWLAGNHIVDVTPLVNLTNLKSLHLQGNPIQDYEPLRALPLLEFKYDMSCELPGTQLAGRLMERNFPSIFAAWHNIINLPTLSWEERLAYHDLYFSPSFGLYWQPIAQGVQLMGDLAAAQEQRDALLAQNPNLLFLVEVKFYAAAPNEYPEAWPHWLRDNAGNRVPDVGWSQSLVDFTHPEGQKIIVQKAVAVAKCGLYNGIFFDWWSEERSALQDHRDLAVEVEAKVNILKRIRAEVGDDFLIMVNTNRSKIPRSAPYVNGTFMETGRDYGEGYTHGGLSELESTLLWAEENLRAPQINGLEGWGIETEPLDSPKNQRWMRVITTLSLTHSDGYVVYVTGIGSQDHEHHYDIWDGHAAEHVSGKAHDHQHEHYWYDFWDAELGQPIGPKAQLYGNRPGVFIREFTNGWAVYNRSGAQQTIHLPQQATGVESGLRNTLHTLPDLDGEIYLKQTTDKNDVNGDGVINILDLVHVANGFGEAAPDVNGDGVVNVLDLVQVANQFR